MDPDSLQVLRNTEEVVVSSRVSSNEEPNLLPPFPSGRSLGAISSFVHKTLSRAHSFTSNITNYKYLKMEVKPVTFLTPQFLFCRHPSLKEKRVGSNEGKVCYGKSRILGQ